MKWKVAALLFLAVIGFAYSISFKMAFTMFVAPR